MDEEIRPPYNLLLEILHECPWTMHVFSILWKNQERFSLKVYMEDVEDIYLISTTIFKQYLLDLSKIDALSFQLCNDHIKIKLYPNYSDDEIDAKGLTLC